MNITKESSLALASHFALALEGVASLSPCIVARIQFEIQAVRPVLPDHDKALFHF